MKLELRHFKNYENHLKYDSSLLNMNKIVAGVVGKNICSRFNSPDGSLYHFYFHWSKELKHIYLIAVTCSRLEDIDYGTVEFDTYPVLGRYPVGTTASYQCHFGRVLNGSSSLVCQASWTWSPSVPTCYLPGKEIKQIITVRNSNCGKVMFSQACVKNSVHRGVVYNSPRQTPPSRHPSGQTPQGRYPLAQHPQANTPLDRHPVPEMATTADRTRLTGMHSCSLFFQV